MVCGRIEELKQSSHRNNEKQQIIVDWVKIWLSHLYSQRWVQLHDGKHVATGMTTMKCKSWAKYTLTRHKGGVLGNNIPSVSHFFWKRPFFEVCKLDQSIFWVSVIHQTFYLSSSKSCYNHTNLISNLILIDCIFDPHGLFF